MQFAHVDGKRREAMPALSGRCPCCESPVIPKCGSVRVHHWAHQRENLCDRWWKNETEWHRNWKGQFPEHWQEFVYRADDGEKHIADVKTEDDWVIEFQHSHITPEERRSRDAFYKKLVWVVDATRRKSDAVNFAKELDAGTPVGGNPYIRRVRPNECRLLREWCGSPGPIFFDFGVEQTLCWLIAKQPDEPAYVGLFMRQGFIDSHLGKGPEFARNFDEFVKTYYEIASLSEAYILDVSLRQTAREATGFQHYLARRRVRRRF